jgi:DnaJ-class molecular chaperone
MGQGTTVQHNKFCSKCKGKKTIYMKKVFELKLPKGIPNHYEVCMEGKGSYNQDTKRCNDIKFRFIYDIKEPYMIDKDLNVHYKLTIQLEELLCGFKKIISIYNEQLCLVSNHYFNPSKTLILKGKGLYDLSCEKSKDLHIHFEIQYSDQDRFKKYIDVLRKMLKYSDQQNNEINEKEIDTLNIQEFS